MARPAAVKADDFGKLDKTVQADYESAPDKDGYHRFALEPVNGLSLGEMEKTLATLSKERDIRLAKEKTLAQMVDDEGSPFDPGKTRNALKKYSEMANWTPVEKMKEQVEAMKAEIDGQYQGRMKELSDRGAELEAAVNETVVDAALNAAIASDGANPLLADLLRPRVKPVRDDATKKYVARIMDENGSPKLSEKTGGPIGWEEYFAKLKAIPKYQPFFPGNGMTGTGGTSPARLAAGSGGGGQFRMQNKYAKEHPGEYAKMGDEARKVGKTVELHD